MIQREINIFGKYVISSMELKTKISMSQQNAKIDENILFNKITHISNSEISKDAGEGGLMLTRELHKRFC